MASTWSHAEVHPIAGWDSQLAHYRSAARTAWGERAAEAGYKPKKGAELVETVVPLWQNSAGNYTDVPGTGDAIARKLVITGVVTRKKK